MITPEHRARVIELSRKGVGCTEIAEMLGLKRTQVSRLRHKHGVSAPGNVLLTDDEKTRAKAFLDDGAPYTEVAETLGRATETLRRHLPGYSWTKKQVADHRAAVLQYGKMLGL